MCRRRSFGCDRGDRAKKTALAATLTAKAGGSNLATGDDMRRSTPQRLMSQATARRAVRAVGRWSVNIDERKPYSVGG